VNLAEQKAALLERAAVLSESMDESAEGEFNEVMSQVDSINAQMARQARVATEREALTRAFPASSPAPLTRGDDVDFTSVAMSVYRGDMSVLRADTELGNFYLPEVVWGNIKEFVDKRTPLTNSVNRLPLTETGSAFTRVYDLSDLNTGASTVPEFGLVPTSVLEEDAVIVPVTKVAGRHKVSVESIDRRGQSTMAQLEQALATKIARYKEQTVANAIVAAATETNTLSATADGQAILTALATAANDLLDVSGGEPTTIYLAPDRATYLGSLFAEDGRPFFPLVGPSNALGTLSGVFGSPSMPGAQVVVSGRLPSGFVAVADPTHLEWYEGGTGYLSVDVPANAAREWTLYQYVAHCFWSEGIIRLVP
jgi:hypothetical protein